MSFYSKSKDATSGRQNPSKYSLPNDKYSTQETIARGVWRFITRDYENPDRVHTNFKNVEGHGFNGVPGLLTTLSIKGVSFKFILE